MGVTSTPAGLCRVQSPLASAGLRWDEAVKGTRVQVQWRWRGAVLHPFNKMVSSAGAKKKVDVNR